MFDISQIFYLSVKGKNRREKKLLPSLKLLFFCKWYLTFHVCECMCGSVDNQCFLRDSAKESIRFMLRKPHNHQETIVSLLFLFVLMYWHSMMRIAEAARRKEDSISHTALSLQMQPSSWVKKTSSKVEFTALLQA